MSLPPTQEAGQQDAGGPGPRAQEPAVGGQADAIGTLAAGFARDLDSVLSSIRNAAPALRGHATDPEDLRIIDSLEQSAARGEQLMRQILAFAQRAGGVRRLVRLRDVLEDTFAMASRTFPPTVSVVKQFEDGLWPVMADPAQIHQALLALCANGRNAMPGGGTLRLRAENCVLDREGAKTLDGAREGVWVVLHVEDNGPGLAPHVLAHLWDPFPPSRTGGDPSIPALSSVRSVVESHDGFVIVKSDVGRGTTFRIHLPARAGDPEGTAAAPSARRGNGELVVIVDDDTAIRDLTAAILTRNGYRVLTARSGTEALAVFAERRNEINVLITDLIMPNLDGAALAGIVRHMNPSVKLLAMSGVSTLGREEKMQAFGGAFLFKPFKPQELLAAVDNLLHPSLQEPSA